MARISFDFDGVLTNEAGRQLLKQKMKQGDEIWIITARRYPSDGNDSVLDFARENNIPVENIIFTGGRDKYSFIQKYRIETHYDNNPEQIEKINRLTKSRGVLLKQ